MPQSKMRRQHALPPPNADYGEPLEKIMARRSEKIMARRSEKIMARDWEKVMASSSVRASPKIPTIGEAGRFLAVDTLIALGGLWRAPQRGSLCNAPPQVPNFARCGVTGPSTERPSARDSP